MNTSKLCSIALCCAAASGMQAQVIINEFSASNLAHFPLQGAPGSFYEGTNFHDWIELRNLGSEAIDLGGWHLSDQASNPTRFVIPAGTMIEPGGHRLFVCSGYGLEGDGLNTAVDAYGHVNTNFKLKQSTGTEAVVLADAGGVIIDMAALTQVTAPDHSWARCPDGVGPWTVQTAPTPNEENQSEGYAGYAPEVAFDQVAGYHTGPIQLAMTNSDADAVIRYTLNGHEPTASSAQYTGPLSLSETTIVRARAFSADPAVLPGLTTTSTFFFGNDVHTITVISVCGTGLGPNLGQQSSTSPIGALEVFNTAGERLSVTGGTFDKHGNESLGYAQRGFDYIASDETGLGADIAVQLFADSERDHFQRIILKAAGNDNYPFAAGCHIRDGFAHTLTREADLNLDSRAYTPVVLYWNGDYWGLYELREKVDDPDYTEFYHNQGRQHLHMMKTWGGTWAEYGGNEAIADWQATVDFILQNDMSESSNYALAASMIDINSVIDNYIIHAYLALNNWLSWDAMWWRGTSEAGAQNAWRYSMWDLDYIFSHGPSFGWPQFGPNSAICKYMNSGNAGGQGHIPILNALAANPEFAETFSNRYDELKATYLSCDFMQAHLADLVAAIEPEMPRQIQRWGGSMAGWTENVQDVQDWIGVRCFSASTSTLAGCLGNTENALVIQINGPGGVSANDEYVNQADSPWTSFAFAPGQVILSANETDGPFLGWSVLSGDIDIADTQAMQTVAWLNTGGTILAVFDIVEGIDEPMGASVSLSPNPFDEHVTLSFSPSNPPVALRVADSAGRPVHSMARPGVRVNTSQLAPGIYFFELTLTDGSIRVLKAVKER